MVPTKDRPYRLSQLQWEYFTDLEHGAIDDCLSWSTIDKAWLHVSRGGLLLAQADRADRTTEQHTKRAQAEDAFRRALRHSPSTTHAKIVAYAHAGLATIAYRNEDWEPAALLFERALASTKLTPANAKQARRRATRARRRHNRCLLSPNWQPCPRPC